MLPLIGPVLFRRMLALQQVVDGDDWEECEELIRRASIGCEACSDPAYCRTWLDAPRKRATYPEICPNGAILEACRIILDGSQAAEPSKENEPELADLLADPLVREVEEADNARRPASKPSA